MPMMAYYGPRKPSTVQRQRCRHPGVRQGDHGVPRLPLPKIDGDEIVEYPAANIGVAVGVEDGLTVPVMLAPTR